jgi:hypothetical protein
MYTRAERFLRATTTGVHVADNSDGPATRPLVEFFSLYEDIHAPEPGSRDIRGSMPARAAQRCPPVTEAAAFGWYVYPPVDLALRWNGGDTEWSPLEDNEPVKWRSLAGGVNDTLQLGRDVVAQLRESGRDGADLFDTYGGTVPFIDADPRGPDRIEMVTGLLVRTRPGWVLHVRQAANWPTIDGLQVYEGILETEWYRSFVPTIMRLTTQGKVVRLYKRIPLLSVTALPKAVVEANSGTVPVYAGVKQIPDDVWAELVKILRDRQNPEIRATYLSRQREQARRAAAGQA